MIAGLFFILGFVTWLNGSLMPYLELVLQLTPFQASFILFSFYIAVTVFSLSSSWIIRKVGYKNAMAIALAVMACASTSSLSTFRVSSPNSPTVCNGG